MNKKGQTVLVGMMVSIVVFIAVVSLIPLLKETVREARGTTGMDCTNASLSTGEKGTCILLDIFMPYFVGVSIAGGLSYITARSLVNQK